MKDLLEWARLRRLLHFCFAVAVLVVIAGIIYASLLVPVLISFFLTYLLLPVVHRLERWRVPRTPAAAILVLGSVGVLILLAVRLTPVLYSQALLVVRALPDAINAVASTWLPAAKRFVTGIGLMDEADATQLFAVNNLASRLANQVQGGFAGLWKTGVSVAGGVMNVVLIPILTFFLLKDNAAIMGALRSIVPRDLEDPVHGIIVKMDLTLRSVLKGQAIVAGILAVLYVVGLSIVGLQSAIAIGLVAGLCRIIPYFDVIVGGTLSTIVLVSTFTGWGQVLSVVLVFVIVQAIDGAFITPRVIGHRVGLHPLLVILSVLAFGDWLGFWGVLLAIPVAAVVKVLVESLVPYYRTSRAFSGAEPPTDPASEL